jgi:WS/DGAT/MGAT family acyltransferase
MPHEEGTRLSAPDSAWLRMDEPVNLMTITGVLAFEKRLDFARLSELMGQRLASHARFRCRVREPRGTMGPPRWEIDPAFDLAWHVRRVALPAPADRAELQDFVSEQMSQALDPQRPLWCFFYVDNYRYGSALVGRIHHCIGDGVSLMQVMLGLSDTTEAGLEPQRPGTVVGAGAGAVVGSVKGEMATRPRASWLLPLRMAGSSVATLYRLLARPKDPATRIKGPLEVAKRCAWSAPIPLADVKAIGRGLQATVNDVLISAVGGALRRYLMDRGDNVDGLRLRAVVPVNLRPPDDLALLGNRFGLVFLPIPVGEADPLARLATVKRRMDRIKRSPEAFVTFFLLRLIGHTTPGIVSWAINLFGKKATAVMTNVPGPRQAMTICGERVDGLMFWVPQSGRLGLGVSILSYAGAVRVGIATDAALAPDPERIVEAYAGALDELRAAAAV